MLRAVLVFFMAALLCVTLTGCGRNYHVDLEAVIIEPSEELLVVSCVSSSNPRIHEGDIAKVRVDIISTEGIDLLHEGDRVHVIYTADTMQDGTLLIYNVLAVYLLDENEHEIELETKPQEGAVLTETTGGT